MEYNAKAILENKGIKPSLHRLKILEYLLMLKNHPTVETIFKEISDNIPTLSKTTIYNTLKTFHENKVVQSITIEDNEVRYDADVSNHAHFKCERCGMLYDIIIDCDVFFMDTIDGHQVREKQVYFKGLCKNCK